MVKTTQKLRTSVKYEGQEEFPPYRKEQELGLGAFSSGNIPGHGFVGFFWPFSFLVFSFSKSQPMFWKKKFQITHYR